MDNSKDHSPSHVLVYLNSVILQKGVFSLKNPTTDRADSSSPLPSKPVLMRVGLYLLKKKKKSQINLSSGPEKYIGISPIVHMMFRHCSRLKTHFWMLSILGLSVHDMYRLPGHQCKSNAHQPFRACTPIFNVVLSS